MTRSGAVAPRDEFAPLTPGEVLKEEFPAESGLCRLLPSVTTELAEHSTRLAKPIGSVAEDVAQQFFRSPRNPKTEILKPGIPPSETLQPEAILPTPITQSTRANGKEPARDNVKTLAPKRRRFWLPCLCCGKEIDGKHRSYCTWCLEPLL